MTCFPSSWRHNEHLPQSVPLNPPFAVRLAEVEEKFVTHLEDWPCMQNQRWLSHITLHGCHVHLQREDTVTSVRNNHRKCNSRGNRGSRLRRLEQKPTEDVEAHQLYLKG